MDKAAALDRLKQIVETSPSPSFFVMGGELLDIDPEAGTSEVAWHPKPDFANPMGFVQGGFVSAMLDDTAVLAGLAKSGFTQVMPTLEMKTSYLAPAPIARLTGRGRVIRLGRSIAFLEADLLDGQGKLLARTSMTARPTPIPPGEPARS